MMSTSRQLFASFAIAAFLSLALVALAREPDSGAPGAAPADAPANAPANGTADAPTAAPRQGGGDDAATPMRVLESDKDMGAPPADSAAQEETPPSQSRSHSRVTVRRRSGSADNSRVAVIGRVTVGPHETVDGSAVAVFGGLVVDGIVNGDAVCVGGSSEINGTVNGEAVCVMGNLTLGPRSVVSGDVSCVGGHVIRQAGSVVRGSINETQIGSSAQVGPGLGEFWSHVLSHGKAMAFGAHLGWLAWLNAFLLAFYALMALIFPSGIRRCGNSLVDRPLVTILSSFLLILALPVVFVLLLITIVGIPVALLVLPISVLIGILFGRASLYALIGRAISGGRLHPVLSVLAGAFLMLVMYAIPVVGIAFWFLVGFLGLGCSVTTLFGGGGGEAAAPVPAAAVAAMAPAPSGAPAGMPPTAASVPFAGTPGETASVPAGAPAAATVDAAAAAGAAPIQATGPSDAPPALSSPPPAPPPIPPPLPPVSPVSPQPPLLGSARAAASAHPPVHPAPGFASGLPRAGFWYRTAGLAIDLVVVWVAFVFTLRPAVHAVGLNTATVFALLIGAYSAAFWKWKGTTVGGVILHLQVVRIDDRPIDWTTAVIRVLGCFVSVVSCGLGFVWAAFDPEGQSWHDKIAGTTVVRPAKAISLA